ncbi:MAG: sensor domain-containing diguanylate cyclase [Nitrospirota bacterium]
MLAFFANIPMQNEEKTKEQLINELVAFRQRIADLEILETQHKQTEQALIESEERYKRLIKAVTAYTYSVEVKDGHAISTRHTMGCLSITGYNPEDYESDPYLWHKMIYPDDKMIVENSIQQILDGIEVPPIEHRIIRRDGTVVWIRNTMVIYHDEKGLMTRYDGLIEDITERKLAEEELKRLATTDKLTGAYNRTKFKEIIGREIERVKRYNQPLSIIIFDIDHFKEINDIYGHNVGDNVLKTIADIVRENIRKIDYFVRWGGDEFMIISSETDLKEAYLLADRMREIIKSHMFEDVEKVAVSLGVTEFKENDTEDSLIKRADDAMYEAKKKGGDRVEMTVT